MLLLTYRQMDRQTDRQAVDCCTTLFQWILGPMTVHAEPTSSGVNVCTMPYASPDQCFLHPDYPFMLALIYALMHINTELHFHVEVKQGSVQLMWCSSLC